MAGEAEAHRLIDPRTAGPRRFPQAMTHPQASRAGSNPPKERHRPGCSRDGEAHHGKRVPKVNTATRVKALVGAVVVGGVVLTGCGSQADTVSKNLSAEADSFNVERRVVFVNGITDKAILTIEGKCSINDSGSQLEVTCKVGPDAYKKHFLGRSDNMTYFAEQIEANAVDPFHYKVVIRPESLVPNVDVQTSGG